MNKPVFLGVAVFCVVAFVIAIFIALRADETRYQRPQYGQYLGRINYVDVYAFKPVETEKRECYIASSGNGVSLWCDPK